MSYDAAVASLWRAVEKCVPEVVFPFVFGALLLHRLSDVDLLLFRKAASSWHFPCWLCDPAGGVVVVCRCRSCPKA